MEPVKALFRSRKFLLALFGVIQALAFNYFNVPDDVWQSITVLVMVLIASIAYEDGQAKSGASNVQVQNAAPQPGFTPGVTPWASSSTGTGAPMLFEGGEGHPVEKSKGQEE